MSDTDPTSAWFEFISYLRCCESLGIAVSMNKFLAYQKYYNSVHDEKN
jgi:hypothetical protein